jgi:alpha-ribazole phosphatase
VIRHGEVMKEKPNTYNGHRDVDLTPTGIEQLERVADRLASMPIRAVYSSTLRRSRRGAEQIAARHGLPVVSFPDLREKHFGVWEGMTFGEVAERFPEQWARWLADPPSVRPDGGETYEEMRDRVLKALAGILAQHPAEQVAVVAHGGVNRAILCHALGLDLKYVFRIEQDYGALNIIDFHPDGMAVVQVMNAAPQP